MITEFIASSISFICMIEQAMTSLCPQKPPPIPTTAHTLLHFNTTASGQKLIIKHVSWISRSSQRNCRTTALCLFLTKKKKKWEIVCVRLVCTHTMTRSRSCVRASISQGPACLSHKGLFKKKQWQRDNTAAQTKSTFFPPLSFFVFFVLIECAAPNNATFPSTISLCREPAPFFLISLHLNRKEPR